MDQILEQIDDLRTMAEIAVALAGFTGIVATLGRRSQGEWDGLEVLRLRMLLETSLAVLFLALLPMLLRSLQWTSVRIWEVSNSTMALVHIGGIILLAWRAKKLTNIEWPAEEKILTALLLPLSLGLSVAQLAFALGYLEGYGFFLFMLGLLYWLILSALHFVLLLTTPSTDS